MKPGDMFNTRSKMTVKELKELLTHFNDADMVCLNAYAVDSNGKVGAWLWVDNGKDDNILFEC